MQFLTTDLRAEVDKHTDPRCRVHPKQRIKTQGTKEVFNKEPSSEIQGKKWEENNARKSHI